MTLQAIQISIIRLPERTVMLAECPSYSAQIAYNEELPQLENIFHAMKSALITLGMNDGTRRWAYGTLKDGSYVFVQTNDEYLVRFRQKKDQ